MNQLKKFTEKHPAGSIYELLRFLSEDSQEDYIFRGQTKDYEFLIPSMFRQGLTRISQMDGWVPISNDHYNLTLSDRDRAKAMVRSALMRSLGKGIGNIIAQQYGLASETVDISDNPKIAAFFATRSYPYYSHYKGTPENPTGVIYRFRKWPPPRNLEFLELTMHIMSLDYDSVIKKLWFKNRVALPALANKNDVDTLKQLSLYFETYGATEADMQTTHNRLHCSAVLKLYKSLRRRYAKDKPKLTRSRLANQQGGFMYPIIWHRCIRPTSISLVPTHWPGEYYGIPDLVAIKDIVAVNNLKSAPDFEGFHFYHSADTILGLEREFLWPSTTEDQMKRYVTDLAQEVARQYLSDYNTKVDDPNLGLVDPGFFDT